ncbi:MAG: hypothetical protein IPK75_01975 [Acidobacteria bacterium]|nr:hypothetical protein [Acidobacteriota bacterium]
MNLITLILVPFVVSLAACWLMIRLGPKDAPDGGRKLQAAPVPSSGGMGVLAGILAGIGAIAMLGSPVTALLSAPPLAGVAAFTVLAAFLGWIDDVYGLPAMAKLVALVVAAVGSIAFGPQPSALWIGHDVFAIPIVLGILGAAAFVFVMANAVNFMDGANGIAMGTALIILAAMGLLLAPGAAYSPDQIAPAMLMALLFASVAALAGFLFWNLPGRLFAGDAGSLSVGGLIGGATVMYALNGQVLVPLTLCLPILIDVFMTLAWRARRGLPLMQAHTDHAYQLLLRAGWSHAQVARLWWGMTAMTAGAVIAGPFAATSGAYTTGGIPLDVAVFVGVLTIGIWLWLRQRANWGVEADQ